MNYKLIILLFMLSSCIDFEIIDSGQAYGDYILDANVAVRSNTNFPIESALVKMDWKVPSYFDYLENEWHYYMSDRDSGYTNSSGDVNLSASMNSTYLSSEESPEVSFYVSCSGFRSDTITIDCNQFDSSMWDSTYNVYRQSIEHTIYLIPEN